MFGDRLEKNVVTQIIFVCLSNCQAGGISSQFRLEGATSVG